MVFPFDLPTCRASIAETLDSVEHYVPLFMRAFGHQEGQYDHCRQMTISSRSECLILAPKRIGDSDMVEDSLDPCWLTMTDLYIRTAIDVGCCLLRSCCSMRSHAGLLPERLRYQLSVEQCLGSRCSLPNVRSPPLGLCSC